MKFHFFILASDLGNLDIVNALINASADLDIQDNFNQSALIRGTL
jgi:hypothetical protein